jgi:predicted MFS family arabinose efflux permease
MIVTKNFLIVWLINFLVLTTYYLLFVISSSHAMETFRVSPSTAGLLAGQILLGCLVGRFLSGRQLDISGFKKVFLTGLLIYNGSLALHQTAPDLWMLMLLRFCSGLGIGCIGSVTGTLIPYLLPAGTHGRGISYFSLSTILALALGPFLGIFLVRHMGYAAAFLFCLLLGLASLACAFFVTMPQKAKDPRREHLLRTFRLSDYIDFAVLPIAGVTLLFALCYGTMQAFLAPYAASLGLQDAASAFFLVYAGTALVSRPLTGRLFDRKGADVVAYPALIAAACGFLVLAHTASSPGLFLAGAVLGAGIGNFQTIAQAITVTLVAKERLGQATSTYFIFFDLGIALGPYFLGFLVPAHGYQGVYTVAAVISLLCVPFYRILRGKKRSGGKAVP